MAQIQSSVFTFFLVLWKPSRKTSMTIWIDKLCRFISEINTVKENTESVRAEMKVGKITDQQNHKNSQKCGTQL